MVQPACGMRPRSAREPTTVHDVGSFTYNTQPVLLVWWKPNRSTAGRRCGKHHPTDSAWYRWCTWHDNYLLITATLSDSVMVDCFRVAHRQYNGPRKTKAGIPSWCTSFALGGVATSGSTNADIGWQSRDLQRSYILSQNQLQLMICREANSLACVGYLLIASIVMEALRPTWQGTMHSFGTCAIAEN